MSKEISLKSFNFLPVLKKIYSKYRRHTVFAVILVVLFIYVLVVLKINQLSNAEPTADQETIVTNAIPKIDGNAIKQIQALENSNTQVHALFEKARNNPFGE